MTQGRGREGSRLSIAGCGPPHGRRRRPRRNGLSALPRRRRHRLNDGSGRGRPRLLLAYARRAPARRAFGARRHPWRQPHSRLPLRRRLLGLLPGLDAPLDVLLLLGVRLADLLLQLPHPLLRRPQRLAPLQPSHVRVVTQLLPIHHRHVRAQRLRPHLAWP
ncbi:hypothetical protein I4F81_010452 [Pyropia yezoensis]|uniref:Uncharacterized protein n=1 Tax=Pyropia yezoensis TaxID=2788 RepID=A0ACC3CCY3_PYRYE|nr:hypothetical protein I4F81_010452 [Neopyropia yezoensis]